MQTLRQAAQIFYILCGMERSLSVDCNFLCDRILSILAAPPRELLGRFYDFPAWHKSNLKEFLNISESAFKTALAYLNKNGHIRIEDVCFLYITDEGLIFLDQNERYSLPPENNFVVLPYGIVGPRATKSNPEEDQIVFLDCLGNIEKDKLIKFLEINNYVNEPSKFVNFLSGKHTGIGVHVIKDKITEVCYLLKELKLHNHIQVNKGRYQGYIEKQIGIFSMPDEKICFTKELRKTTSQKWLQSNTAKRLNTLVASFKQRKYKP